MIDIDAGPQSYALMEYKKENKAAVVKINKYGGDGKHLSNKALKLTAALKMKKIVVTVPISRERQDALEKAYTAGQFFFASGRARGKCGQY